MYLKLTWKILCNKRSWGRKHEKPCCKVNAYDLWSTKRWQWCPKVMSVRVAILNASEIILTWIWIWQLFPFTFQIIPESDAESPIAPRRQERERDWVSQINDIPSQNGFYKNTNGFDTTDRKAYPLKQTPSFLEDVCDDFERTLERSKTKPTRQVQIADAVDYYSYSSSGGKITTLYSFHSYIGYLSHDKIEGFIARDPQLFNFFFLHILLIYKTQM